MGLRAFDKKFGSALIHSLPTGPAIYLFHDTDGKNKADTADFSFGIVISDRVLRLSKDRKQGICIKLGMETS